MANILIYTSNEVSPSIGGVERVASMMYYGLWEKGHNVMIAFINQVNNDDNIPGQIKITQDNSHDYICCIIRRNNIDVAINLCALYNTTSIPITTAAFACDIKLVSVYHNSFDSLLWENRWLCKFMKNKYSNSLLKFCLSCIEKFPLAKEGKFIYNNSDKAILLSRSYIKDFKFYISSDVSRVAAIENPMPFNVAPSSWDNRENIALFVGRLDYQKGLDKLLRIWANTCRDNWKLIIVGTGPLEEYLINLAKQRTFGNSVEFVGHQNPIEYYNRAKIFCMTSLYEGFPMVLIESMSMGCVPIIFDSYSAAAEIASDNGFLVKAFDECAYAEVLSGIIKNDYPLQELSVKAIVYAKRFDINRIITLWDNLIQSLTN